MNGQNAYRGRTRRDADTQLEPPRRVHRTTVQEKDGKYSVVCTIGDMSSDVFRMELAMPDKLTAPTTILPICSCAKIYKINFLCNVILYIRKVV